MGLGFVPLVLLTVGLTFMSFTTPVKQPFFHVDLRRLTEREEWFTISPGVCFRESSQSI